MPEGIWYPAHRIATSGKYTDPLHTIETEWSYVDVVLANRFLDAWEDAVAQADKPRTEK